ncbi:hypothetical protein SNEBB_002751, partial [Seison nebaliae]
MSKFLNNYFKVNWKEIYSFVEFKLEFNFQRIPLIPPLKLTRERRLNCFLNLKKQYQMFALSFFDGIDSVYVPKVKEHGGNDDDENDDGNLEKKFSSDYHENSQHIMVVGRRKRIINIQNIELLTEILNEVLEYAQSPECGFIRFPGNWFIDRSCRMIDLGEGIGQYSVVYSKIILYHQNLFQILDVKKKNFPVSENLVDLFELTFKKSLKDYFLQKTNSEKIKFEKMVKNYQVKFGHHQFPINSISNENVNSVKFNNDQSMTEYYKKVWKLNVDGKYPFIISEYKNIRTYLPIDHCRLIFDMNYEIDLNEEQKLKILILKESQNRLKFDYQLKLKNKINLQILFGISKVNLIEYQKFFDKENIPDYHKTIYLEEKKTNGEKQDFLGYMMSMKDENLYENDMGS